jgi:hypothetical protein
MRVSDFHPNVVQPERDGKENVVPPMGVAAPGTLFSQPSANQIE